MPPIALESKKKTLLNAFIAFIQQHLDHEAHWYAFNLDSSGPNFDHSLSHLLGIPSEESEDYLDLLLALEFRKQGKGGLVFDRAKATAFCQELRVESQADFNEYSPTNELKKVKGLFLRIGKFKDNKDFMPKDQLKEMMKPPCFRIIQNSKPQLDFQHAWRVYKGVEFDVVTPTAPIFDVVVPRPQRKSTKRGWLGHHYQFPKEVSPDKHTACNLPSADGTPRKDKELTTTHDATTVLNIISLNLFNKICDPDVVAAMDVSNLFTKSLSTEEIMDYLATTMMEVENEKADQQRKKDEALKYATNPRVLNLEPKNYPFLTDKRIDVSCSHQVESMLREVVRMKQDDNDILKFSQYNSKPTTLVRVPFSSNTTMFHKNLKRRKGSDFVDDVLHAMLPPPVKGGVNLNDILADDEMVGGGPKDDARWQGIEHAAEALIVCLSKKFPAAFVSAGDKVGMPVTKERKKMTPATTAAMLDDAAMTQNSLTVLRKYYVKEYGWWFGAASNKIADLAADVVPPTVEVAIVKEQTINYWWKNPRVVITKKLNQLARRLPNLLWNNIDIVVGGDHGQGSFRMSAKVILRQDRKKVKKFEVGLGDVECKTDSYEILKATLSGVINESLKEIIHYERDIDDKIIKDGAYKTIKKMGSEGTSPIIYKSFKHTLDENEELVVERPLRLFISGDLAFYAMVLGMKGSETHACWLCLLKKVSQWEEEPFKKGEERTMQWILANYEKAAEKQERIYGLIEQPLFDAVEVNRYIVPPLHTMLGIANTILTDFKFFVENSVEKAPMELREARVIHTKGEVLWKGAKKALKDFDVIKGPQLATLHQNMMDGSEHLEYLLDFDGENEDIHETDQEVVAISLEIDSITAQRIVLVEALNVASKTWAEAKSALKTASFEKDSKSGKKKKVYYTKPIRARIESVLRKYGIDLAAYHGGDLVGNDCRKLMANAAMIFIEIGQVLEDVCREQGMTDEARRIVGDRCRGVANALVVFDCIFSIVNKRNEEVDLEEDHKELASLVERALTCWRNLKDVNQRGQRNIPPKVHAIVQHLVVQFRMYEGIGDFDESFVELSHQTGKRDMLRSKAMRDRELKYSCISKWDETRTNPLVVAVKEEMAKRKREYKNESIRVSKKQKTSDDRKLSRKNWLDTMVMKDLAEESGKLLAMKEYDARVDAELEAANARLEADAEVAGGEGAQGFIGGHNV